MGCSEDSLRITCGAGYLIMGALTIFSTLLTLGGLLVAAVLLFSPSDAMVEVVMTDLNGVIPGATVDETVVSVVLCTLLTMVLAASFYTIGHVLRRVSVGDPAVHGSFSRIRGMAVVAAAMCVPYLVFRLAYLGNIGPLAEAAAACVPFMVLAVAIHCAYILLRRRVPSPADGS